MKALLHPRGRVRLLYLLLSGLCAGFCMTFPTAVGALLEWAAFIPAALALLSLCEDSREKLTKLWLWGFLFFMSEYLVVYHWFVSLYPLDFTGMSRPSALCVVLLGWVGLSALASFTGGFVFLFTVLLLRSRPAGRHPILRPFLAAAAYAVFEWTQTVGWTGVPWNRLGLGQLAGNFTVTVLPSSLFGPYFITFLLVCVSFLGAQALYTGAFRLRGALALGLAVADLLCGCVLLYTGPSPERTVSAAALQGNVSSKEKWSPDSYAVTMERYTALTAGAAEQGAELVLWPETALPYYIEKGDQLEKLLCGISAGYGVDSVVGSFDYDGAGDPVNVLRLYRADGTPGEGEYAKRHLVPFGEYMPMRRLLSALFPPLTEIAMLARDLRPGTGPALTETESGAWGGLVCFDSIYEPLARESARAGAQAFLLATNDSWFGDSAAVYMHNAQARLRAIENGRWVIRAANTGISSVIDDKGRVIDALDPLIEGCVVAQVGLNGTKTLYTRTGEVFLYLCITFCACVGTLAVCGRSGKKRAK